MIILHANSTRSNFDNELVSFLSEKGHSVSISKMGDATVILANPKDEAVDSIAPPEAEQLSNNVGILSLSKDCKATCRFDNTLLNSELKAKDVIAQEDIVSFEFGGSEFKYPLAEKSLLTYVKNEYTNIGPTSIRVVLEFSPIISIPVLLQVVEGDNEEIIFGQDLISCIEGILS